LAHPKYEFARVTTLQALTHLHSQYSEITSEDLRENCKKMEAGWSPPTPFQELVTQLTDGMNFAAENGVAIPDRMMALIGYDIVLASGVFPEGCRDWRMAPEADKEVEHETKITTETAGYHGSANNAAEPPLSEVAQLMKLMAEQNAARDAQMKEFMAAVTAAKPAPAAPKRERGYCWTHGHTSGTNHTSANCLYPAEGHQQEATAQNKMNGSNAQFRPANRNNRNRTCAQPRH
jgi:hypothetical protein